MGSDSIPLISALVSGGIAGLCVDVSLFPLDTMKTRSQSKQGFLVSGGFRGIYRGLGPVILGSVPGASLFFCTYELSKHFGSRVLPEERFSPVVQMAAASIGELVACVVRVPVEVVKQRAQASKDSSITILRRTLRTEGVAGLYRGYSSTIVREVPFSFVQFPVWEFLKKEWGRRQDCPVSPWQSAVCGGLAGGLSAALTNPLDVAKTRIMLAESNSVTAKGSIRYALVEAFQQRGIGGLFAGVVPRVMWISIGGAIFLGAYEKARIITSYTFS